MPSKNSSLNINMDRDLLLKSTGYVLMTERKKLKKSQDSLSLDSNISKTTISNIENGQKSPTLDTWFRLVSHLEIDISKSIELIKLHYEYLNKLNDI